MSKAEKNVERKLEAVCIPCPDPFILEIDSKNEYYDPSEFGSTPLSNAHNQFNSKQKNKFFLHTYQWKPKDKCCQVLKAHIQVKMTALSSGQSLNSPNAGNDNINIVMNGGTSIVPGERVYSDSTFPFSKGETVIKSYVLTGAQLNWLNTNHKLSFQVQDDTSVNWIKLRLEICCLKKKLRDEKPIS